MKRRVLRSSGWEHRFKTLRHDSFLYECFSLELCVFSVFSVCVFSVCVSAAECVGVCLNKQRESMTAPLRASVNPEHSSTDFCCQTLSCKLDLLWRVGAFTATKVLSSTERGALWVVCVL